MQVEVAARAACRQAEADLVGVYDANWGPRRPLPDSVLMTPVLAAESPMRNGRPLSDTPAWRRAAHFQQRVADAVRDVTRLTMRQYELSVSTGIWGRRLGELQANLDYWTRQDAELGLER